MSEVIRVNRQLRDGWGFDLIYITMSYPIVVDLLISTQSKGSIEAVSRGTDNPKMFRRSQVGGDQGHMPTLQAKFNGR
jgi:hypothetical protein